MHEKIDIHNFNLFVGFFNEESDFEAMTDFK